MTGLAMFLTGCAVATVIGAGHVIWVYVTIVRETRRIKRETATMRAESEAARAWVARANAVMDRMEREQS